MEIACKGSAAEVYELFKTKVEALRSQGRLQVIEKITYQDASKEANAKGTGFEALIQCKDGTISVDLKLGLLLRPMRSTIEEKLRHKIESAINS